jgi:hypothetical protein
VHGDLTDRLRRLEGYARSGGAPEPFLAQVCGELVELVLTVSELRRDALGGQRLNSLQERARLRRFTDQCTAQGYTPGEIVAAARERFGVSRSTFYRRRSAVAEK